MVKNPAAVAMAKLRSRKLTLAKKRALGKLGGRPKSTDRCPCGVYTLARATARGHKCAARARKDKGK